MCAGGWLRDAPVSAYHSFFGLLMAGGTIPMRRCLLSVPSRQLLVTNLGVGSSQVLPGQTGPDCACTPFQLRGVDNRPSSMVRLMRKPTILGDKQACALHLEDFRAWMVMALHGAQERSMAHCTIGGAARYSKPSGAPRWRVTTAGYSADTIASWRSK